MVDIGACIIKGFNLEGGSGIHIMELSLRPQFYLHEPSGVVPILP
jgi:hypothetical protein